MANSQANYEMTVLKREEDGTASPVKHERFASSNGLIISAKLWLGLGYDVHVQWPHGPVDDALIAQLKEIGVVTRT